MRKDVSLKEKDVKKILEYWQRNPKDSNDGNIQYDKIFQLMEKSKSTELNIYVRNYLVIHAVADIEVFFKQSVVWLIDVLNCTPPDMKITTSLNELKLLNKITLGEITAEQFNFQNIKDINTIYSSLLELDFLKEMNTKEISVEKLNELIDLRHKIAHELKSVSKTSEELKEYLKHAQSFITAAATLFIEIFSDDDED